MSCRKCKLVAEIGINHNGDMAVVEKMIGVAAAAGFDYVKFQKRNVDVTTPPSRMNEKKRTPWGEVTYLEYKRHLELKASDYLVIDGWCRSKGIGWYASPWDVDSVRFLQNFEIPYLKIASAGNTDVRLLKAARETGLPLILSTGMTTQRQFESALDIVGRHNVHYILACTSSYPSTAKEMNMEFIRTLKADYGHECRIGFSNHNPGILFAASSVLFGAEMIEVHITLDRSMFGSDQAASIEPEGMFKLCKYVTSLEQGRGDGGWKIWESEKSVIRNLRWRDEPCD